jgi:four helix bundle protein
MEGAIFHLQFVICDLSSKKRKKTIRHSIDKEIRHRDEVMEDESIGKSSQSKADELEERLINFAVRIIKLSANLPNTPAGKHIAGQILRSGTSPAPNYGEARGGESHADFVHKLGIVLKELNETFIWLRIIEGSELLKPELLAGIMEENKELCRIFTSSLKTARSNRKATSKMENGKWQMANALGLAMGFPRAHSLF